VLRQPARVESAAPGPVFGGRRVARDAPESQPASAPRGGTRGRHPGWVVGNKRDRKGGGRR
jgi:hypothetical protein